MTVEVSTVVNISEVSRAFLNGEKQFRLKRLSGKLATKKQQRRDLEIEIPHLEAEIRSLVKELGL